MVEGHQVHRIKAAHAQTLKGKRFTATSPNGRFADGAAAINAAGGRLADVTAIGKNLFYVFGGGGEEKKTGKAAPASVSDPVVVRVHFGMSGRHAAFHPDDEPAPGGTTRLRLEGLDTPVITHLSAMTVEAGGPDLLAGMVAGLGPDPLREDAEPERFWDALQRSRRSVGYELMNQGEEKRFGFFFWLFFPIKPLPRAHTLPEGVGGGVGGGVVWAKNKNTTLHKHKIIKTQTQNPSPASATSSAPRSATSPASTRTRPPRPSTAPPLKPSGRRPCAS